MKKLMTPWRRYFLYFVVFVLLSIIGYVNSPILGVLIGLLFSILLEIYTHISEESSKEIDGKLEKYNEALIDGFSSMHEFETIKAELDDHYGLLINPDGLSGQLLSIIDTHPKNIPQKLTPTFLIKASVEPSALIQEPGLSILFLDSEDSHDLFVRSFNFVQESYLGTTFSKPLVWEFETMDVALETQRRLVEGGKEVKRVFISKSNDKQMSENFKSNTRKQRTKYKINCRYIESDAINNKPILYETWRRLWPYYHELINNRAKKTGKIILLSPDFGIIDRKIFISYLLDSDLNEIGAAVFYKPSFLDLVIRYYKQLFEESRANPNLKLKQ
jgi:hypothetical protein